MDCAISLIDSLNYAEDIHIKGFSFSTIKRSHLCMK